MKNLTPTKHCSSTLHQLCKLIPSHLTEKLARSYGVDKKARTFTPWSHVVRPLFAQLTHAIGLNDVCDFLGHSKQAIRWQVWVRVLGQSNSRFFADIDRFIYSRFLERNMATTVQVSHETLRMLKRAKEETGKSSYDRIIRDLIVKRLKIPNSLFGKYPSLVWRKSDKLNFRER